MPGSECRVVLLRTRSIDPGLGKRVHLHLRHDGELVAWIIGWDLILEYRVSVAAVAVGWGTNFNEFLQNAFGVALPEAISLSPEEGGVVNVPAVVIVLAVTAR